MISKPRQCCVYKAIAQLQISALPITRYPWENPMPYLIQAYGAKCLIIWLKWQILDIWLWELGYQGRKDNCNAWDPYNGLPHSIRRTGRTWIAIVAFGLVSALIRRSIRQILREGVSAFSGKLSNGQSVEISPPRRTKGCRSVVRARRKAGT